jgi:PRC-barrel domain protein
MHGRTETLRYLDAAAVSGPAGRLREVQVRDKLGSSLGKLTGFVVDPTARQLRYFVVEVARWLSKRRYLIPLCPAILEQQQRTVRLECDPGARQDWPEFEAEQFSRFSDDDLVDLLFANEKQRL